MLAGQIAKFSLSLQCITSLCAHFRPFRHCKAFCGFPTINTAHHNERIAGTLFCLLCEPESNEMAQNGFVKPSACDVKEGVASDLETGGGTLNAESA